MAIRMLGKGGRKQMFRTIEEGKAAGFYINFNELAKACRIEAGMAPPPAPPPPPPEPEPEPELENLNKPLTRAEILEYAELFGLDTSVHHAKLRAQVEDKLDAEVGSDNAGVSTDTD